MTEITKSITYLNEYKSLKKAIDDGKTPVLTVGLSAIHKANLAAALGADTARPVLVLTDDDNAANRFAAAVPKCLFSALKGDEIMPRVGR